MPPAVDNRKWWDRYFLPSRDFGRSWVNKAKLIGWPIAVIGVVVGALFIFGVLPPPASYTVTIDPQANGQVRILESRCITSPTCIVTEGDDLLIEVTAKDGYKLKDLDCPECLSRLEPGIPGEPIVIENIRNNLTITPDFQPSGTVRVDSAIGNAVCRVISDGYRGDTCAEVSGRDIELSADPEIPAGEMTFELFQIWQLSSDAWAEGVDLTQSTIEVTVPESLGTLDATAVYSGQDVLTIVNNAQGVDFLESNIPPHYDCDETSAPIIRCRFDEDELISLTLAADRSDDTRRFVHWLCVGGNCGSGRPIGVHDGLFILRNEPLGGNMTVTPIFEEITFTALTTYDGLGGRVRADCERTNNCMRESGWRTEVTATPDDGYRFVSWDCVGNSCSGSLTANPLRLVLNSDVTLTPIFEEVPTVGLTIGAASNGRAAADCGSNCDREIGWRTTVTATPNSGHRFVRWDCIGSSCPSFLTASPLSLTLDSDITLTPIFEEVTTASLTIGVASNGRAAADCGSNCDREIGWRTTVTATPNDRYEFAGWNCTGSCPSGNISATAHITINENTSITPIFRLISTPPPPPDNSGSNERTDQTPDDDNGDSRSAPTRVLTVRVNGEGSVSTSEGNCNSRTCRYTVQDGATIRLTASADRGYRFAGWSGAISGSSSSSSISITRNQSVTARFEKIVVACDYRDVQSATLEYNSSSSSIKIDLRFRKNCTSLAFYFQIWAATSAVPVALTGTLNLNFNYTNQHAVTSDHFSRFCHNNNFVVEIGSVFGSGNYQRFTQREPIRGC